MPRYIWTLAGGLLLLAGCATTSAPRLPDGKNRVVDIVNTSDAALQFYATNAEQRQLARRAGIKEEVAANYYLTLNFDDGSGACLFDFRAQLANGQTAEAARFDTCAEVSWVIGQ